MGDSPKASVSQTGAGHSPTAATGGPVTQRSRAGYRTINTIPEGIGRTRAAPDASRTPVELLSNFIRVQPMAAKEIIKYRVDFEPNIESTKLRRSLFNKVRDSVFSEGADFDGMYDIMCNYRTQTDTIVKEVTNPTDETTVTLTIKQVGTVNWVSDQMVRVYNMNMKALLRALGFFPINKLGSYVHLGLTTRLSSTDSIALVGGFKTACNIHEDGQILMNLENVHKLLQRGSVLDFMTNLKRQQMSTEHIKEQLTGKLVVTMYNKEIYKIEDVNFQISASNVFKDHKSGRDISYVEYYKTRYDKEIKAPSQPLLLGVPNARKMKFGEESKEIYLVPELCYIAGLTDAQRCDNRLKRELIEVAQVMPVNRVGALKKFIGDLHNNERVAGILNKWAYNFDRDLVTLKSHIIKRQRIGIGRHVNENPNNWPEVDKDGGFENEVKNKSLAKVPAFKSMHVIITRPDANNERTIIDRIKGGFMKVGLRPENVETHRLDRDTASEFVNQLRRIPNDTTAIIIILPSQNKEKYDTIKKHCAVERGIVTQVVTSRLMMADNKFSGASVKIAIQVAAKIGGEPWYNHMPVQALMICGYDTYHDTAKRGRSFGAFLASMNQQRSRWWSKADCHEHLDELSTHVAENMRLAMNNFKEVNNGKYPERIVMYRDGVGDGQLEHVFKVELTQMIEAIESLNDKTKLTFVVVNKRVGARFFQKNNETFLNPPPGTVVDDVVTRKERFDFYLISQSTRRGTVAPTYYNIIYDKSGFDAGIHQLMAYKMCFMYYNWAGTVKVPAPCQYAHKLALLCGEHLHDVPNAALADRLHFL